MKKIVILSVGIVLFVTVGFAQADKSKSTQGKQQSTAKPATQPKAQAQTKEEPKLSPTAEHAWRKYTIASRWNDLDLAKDALYDLIIEFPQNDSLIFALAIYYYENQKYASSALIGQDLLSRQPKSPQVLDVVAQSYEGLNLLDRALQYYESLYLAT